MPRTERGYRCSSCGWTTVAYVGRCPRCQAWNTLEPFAEAPRGTAASRRPGAPAPAAPLVRLGAVEGDTAERHATAIPEFDRVLGGGIVPGSLILVGGDPGIGKSTLTLQAAASLARGGLRVACICGEESPRQVRMRAERLGVADAPVDLIADPSLDAALAAAESAGVDVLVVDSIQSVTVEGLESRAGGPAQLAEAGARLLAFAKGTGTATLVTGHVTKGGEVAGPKLLEHLVDVVLYFESAEGGVLRLLRAVKNRFGATDELGLFEMTGAGLQSVENASAAFLAPHAPGASGCAITAVFEGSRPLAVEVQALAVPSALAAPRRIAAGIEPARLHLLLALLARRGGIPAGALDIVASVSGGLRLRDTSADLAICLALASAIHDRPLPAGTAFLGELALSGAVRPVHQASRRLAELARLGLRGAVVPAGTPAIEGLQLTRVASLADALERVGLSGLPVRAVPHHDALQQPQRGEQADQ
ncbi:MAG: DNA repair protein RadA [Dehalococcoidia bacterium]|nr:DNA repair protein RadA [Dehalococcoidia bacterium]